MRLGNDASEAAAVLNGPRLMAELVWRPKNDKVTRNGAPWANEGGVQP